MKYPSFLSALILAASFLAVGEVRANNMATVSINSQTGAVTLTPRWVTGPNLAGFHFMAQDLSLGGGATQFYSIKGTAIPSGGDVAAFTRYIAASGAATNHADIGSKLTPSSYSALTSADPDVGYGSVNFYLIHHKSSGDYFTAIVPSSGTASAVTDLKPMSGPGGPATLGASGYFGLTFAAANLGYGLNYFYYFRTDAVTGFTKFGTLDPALLGTSADKFDLGLAGYNALAFTGTDVGYGNNQMYYLRLDPVTGFTIFGTLHPLTGRTADIANLGSVYATLTFAPGSVGFGTSQFYTTGSVNTTGQTVSFAAIADRPIGAGSFTVSPSASSGLPVTLTVVAGSTGSASISGPVGGVFTVTPTAPGIITLQATQAGQTGTYEFNMLRQSFTVSGSTTDFNGDGKPDILLENISTGQRVLWLMGGPNNAYVTQGIDLGSLDPVWHIAGIADFGGDGKPDILLENTSTGQRVLWLMGGPNNAYVIQGVDLGVLDPAWRMVGVADFSGDGKPDILLENSGTGQRVLWLMGGPNNAYVTQSIAMGSLDPVWHFVGIADFNGDAKADILLENQSNGQRVLWLMGGPNNAYVTLGVDLGSLDPVWHIVYLSDFNGDGKPDILLENRTTGERVLWIMGGPNNAYVMQGISLGSLDPVWHIVH